MSFGFLFLMKAASIKIGREIKQFRLKRDWRQADLATVANLPTRTIGRIERGEVDVRISTLAKIAKALGTTPKNLLP